MSKLLHYDPDTQESLWLLTSTPGTSEPASFGFIEGQGFVPSPVVYLAGSGSSTVNNTNSSLASVQHLGTGKGKWAFYNMPGSEYSGPRSLLYTGTWSYYQSHRRGGGPPVTTPTSTVPSKASSDRAMAQVKKSGGPRQRSQRGGRARGKCPKGHYWSYKLKKCVKTKFR